MNKDGKTFLKTCVKYSDAAVSHLCNEENIPSWFSTLKSKASHLRSNLCVQKRVFFPDLSLSLRKDAIFP